MPHRDSLSAATIAAALLIVAPIAARAQMIHGHVEDAASTASVRLAAIELLDERGVMVSRALSDSAGVFRIRGWQAGKYRLKTTALGYATVTSEPLELATGDLLRLTVKLAPDAVPLDPIVIRERARATLAEIALTGYYDRRDTGQRLGLGRFFDRGAIQGRGRRLTDVLATIPGVRILRVQNCPVPLVSMAGNNATRLGEVTVDQLVRNNALAAACNPVSVCRANIYVDGVQMAFDETVSIDTTIPLDWVEAIEIYRRAAEVPAEFLGRATCGVVAVWTRRG